MPDLFGNSKLRDELNGWRRSIETLSAEDKSAFERAIEDSSEFVDLFIESAPKGHETEALLISIALSQQKRIRELNRAVGRRVAETQSR